MLRFACQEGHIEVVKILLAQPNIILCDVYLFSQNINNKFQYRK